MKLLSLIKPAIGLGLLGCAVVARLSPQTFERLISNSTPAAAGTSEHYQLVEGSVYDGDTFRVSNGSGEIKVRLCGLDAPEMKQAMGTESRDHLRALISKGDGQIILTKTDIDQYGRTIAEAFIPLAGSEEEIHLNSQMVNDGMAYVYPQYVDSCPNATPMRRAEATAKAGAIGVWNDAQSQKPWDYRRRS